MAVAEIQLYGGPLDGLFLVIPEPKARLIFPVLAADPPRDLPKPGELLPVQNLVYEWLDPPGRFLWRGVEG